MGDKIKYTLFGKTISGPFTIPSGIITTTVDSMKLYAETIPSVGILTTKSISKKARKGNPTPILEQVTEWQFRNAVGLANPGVNNFVKELKEWRNSEDRHLLDDKFLLASIFGENAEEFIYVARKLEPHVDGLELNISCPHADAGGALIGSDPKLTKQIVKAVKNAVDVPIITKLTPNVDSLASIVDAAMRGGTDGLSLINTWGPQRSNVLSKGIGGVSGRRIKQVALESVEQVSSKAKTYKEIFGRSIPIIGMGGIYNSADVLEFKEAGADFFGIGTALFDKTHKEQKKFLEDLVKKYEFNERDYSVKQGKAKKYLMNPKPITIKNIIEKSDDLRVYEFNDCVNAKPGQFVELWIPGVAEKPFSVAWHYPFTIAVKKHKGKNFTSALWGLKQDDKIKVRGPYGRSFPSARRSADLHIIVGGGVGTAPLLMLAKELSDRGSAKTAVRTLLGARTKDEFLFTEKGSEHYQGPWFEQYSVLELVTDDSSSEKQGFVTDLLEDFLSKIKKTSFNIYTCGPEAMMKRVLEIASEHPNFKQGYASVERYMKCGMGGCGSCVMDGKSTCKDGPVRSWEVLKESKDFGRYKRDATGQRVKI